MKVPDEVARGFAAIAAALLAGKADPGPTFYDRADKIASWIQTGDQPERRRLPRARPRKSFAGLD